MSTPAAGRVWRKPTRRLPEPAIEQPTTATATGETSTTRLVPLALGRKVKYQLISDPRAKAAPRRNHVLRYPTLAHQPEQPSHNHHRVAATGSVAFAVRQRAHCSSVHAEGSNRTFDKQKPYQRSSQPDRCCMSLKAQNETTGLGLHAAMGPAKRIVRPHCELNRTISPLSLFINRAPPDSFISLQDALPFSGFVHHFPSSVVQEPESAKLPTFM